MKVLIVNSSDIDGGAARAALRLHKSLLSSGLNSRMLVVAKRSDEYTVYDFNNPISKIFNKLRPFLDSLPTRRCKNTTLFSASWVPSPDIVKKINEINPDIVHLHWVNAGMLRVEDISKINAPIVWSLHDMWPFTGGCHYDEECGKYVDTCGSCPVLKSSKGNDLSKRGHLRKQNAFKNIPNLVVVGLSRWLQQAAASSYLFRDQKVTNLPNPIDTNIFKAFDKDSSRKLWNLPVDKKLILFGAMGATSDPRKGFAELSSALKSLNRDDVEFVVFGASAPKEPIDLGTKVHYVGSLADDVSLITLYSATDVMVVPSIQENLSNAIMESLSCSTPVVAFNIGGNSDLIEHKINGYLSEPYEHEDLAYGIGWVLDNHKYEEVCLNARKKVIAEFSSEVVVRKYIDLYQEVLSE